MTDLEITQEMVHDFNEGWSVKNAIRQVDKPFERIMGQNVLNRLINPLSFMAELWELSAPGAVASFQVPHGAGDEAFEDPRNVRPMFHNSFGIFSQPAHEETPELKYAADWRTETITFAISENVINDRSLDAVMLDVMTMRNQVNTMVALMVAVKPSRVALKENLENPNIDILQV